MKYTKRLLLSALCFVGVAGTPTLAASAAQTTLNPLHDKVVRVQFQPTTPESLIQEISHAFQAPMTRLGDHTYIFEVPALKTQDQYAELFAVLPSVLATEPVPEYKVADHIQPKVVNLQALDAAGKPLKAEDYMPGEVLVKFKGDVSASDIAFFNQSLGASQISRIPSIGVVRLRLPEGMDVQDAISRYEQSGLVEYAEPNATMGLPRPVNGPLAMTPIPLDGGGQMLVHFRPGSSQAVLDKFQRIYGTRWVKKTSFYSYRVQLPAGLNPAVAARVFKLYPGVNDVQRLYS